MKKSKSKSYKSSKISVRAVDLFCGAGGLTRGLENVGVDVRLGIDVDPACRFPFTANNKAKFLLKSIEDVKGEELEPLLQGSGVRLLAGCAPCQTFSTYNQKAKQSDKRWWLLSEFSRLIGELLPEIVMMENVPRLVEQDVFESFIRHLKNSGYHVSYRIVNCKDYGVPQQRRRLVLLASKLGPIDISSSPELEDEFITVRDAIGSMPPLDAGEISGEDPLHQSAALSPTNLRRIRESIPGGTWRNWRRGLIAKCHKKTTGKTYPSVYGRMTWDEPAPTLTTQFFGFGNGRFGHPEQDRAISLREGSILQSFPPDYVFTAPETPICKEKVGRLIGNAVPVKLGEAIGRSVIKHVADYHAKNKNILQSMMS